MDHAVYKFIPQGIFYNSFTSLHLDDLSYNYNCLGRNHIELGPLPSKLVCGPLSDENQVFISERNHVWIKLIRGDDSFDKLAKFQFQYIGRYRESYKKSSWLFLYEHMGISPKG